MNRTLWFARHEFRLAWRDFIGMVTAGKPRRARIAVAIVLAFAAVMHLIAWKMVGRYADIDLPPDREMLVAVTGSALLACTVMISQAMESVTRAFYSRADLDLLISSPAPTRPIFMLRTAASGVAASALALVLAGPFINALALAGGAHWLSAYGVLLSLAATSTAFAVGLTVLLFRLLGPRRTRFVAQVVAAIVGAVFVIGVQVVSIYAYGNLSRFDAFHSRLALEMAPGASSLLWLPARAAMGDPTALLVVLATGALAFALAVSVASRRFGEFSLAAAGLGTGSVRQKAGRPFRRASAAATLRRKEWTLLARDPWLMSQTLMQILYLIPPALLLWHNYSAAGGALVVMVPVLVMAAGQLAGGLAWLAISGEDAPDLVSTAPVRRNAVLRAKIEAVIGLVAIVLAPIVLALATASPWTAMVAAVGALCAAGSATAIQLFFRAQAKRSHFRRRQTSSRIATFAEAFSSVGWAASGGLAADGSPVALLTVAATLAIVAVAGAFRPRGVPA